MSSKPTIGALEGKLAGVEKQLKTQFDLHKEIANKDYASLDKRIAILESSYVNKDTLHHYPSKWGVVGIIVATVLPILTGLSGLYVYITPKILDYGEINAKLDQIIRVFK